MKNKQQALWYIKTVLQHYGLYREYREYMIYETMMVESDKFMCNKQRGIDNLNICGLGYIQMELKTYKDIMNRFVKFRPYLQKIHDDVIGGMPVIFELRGNINFQIIMCCIHYLRVPEAIPDTKTGRSIYWKDNYNTSSGKGTVEKYLKMNK